MSTHHVRSVLRATVLAVIAPLVAASFALLASPAEAAWTSTVNVHDAKAQVCKVKRADGWKIKIRVNNRRAPHGHYGTLFRTRGDKLTSVKVWAKRGKTSATKSLRWKKGDYMDVMISERNGVGAGGGTHPSHMRRC